MKQKQVTVEIHRYPRGYELALVWTNEAGNRHEWNYPLPGVSAIFLANLLGITIIR